VLELIVVNLRRRRSRALLTAVGIAVGVATIVALLALTAGLRRSAGELIHLGRADFGLFQGGLADLTASSLPASLAPRIAAEPGVADVSPIQLVTDALPGEPSFLVFGAPPTSFLAERLVMLDGRRARGREAMLGEAAARQLGLGPGDTLVLRQGRVPIAGVYRSGVGFEDGGAVLPLDLTQRMTDKPGAVSTIAVAIEPGVRASTLGRRIERRYPGTVAIEDPGEVARADTNGLLISKATLVIAVLALVIGGISVTNTMLISVLERQRELGVLAAVGWRPRQIAELIFGEGVAVSLIGAGLGLGLGVAGAALAVRALGASELVSPHVTAWVLGRGLLVGIAIGVLGGLYPAWRVTRLRPVEALGRE